MKINRSPRPKVPINEAITIARTCFGINGKAIELSGERDRNFLIIDNSDQKFLLKVCNPADSIDIIDFQNELLLYVASKNSSWKWQTPQLNLNGEFISNWESLDGNKLKVRLLTYLDGIFLSDFSPQNFFLMRDLGEFIGHVNHSLSDFTHPAMHRKLFWDLKNGVELVKTHLRDINDNYKIDKINLLLEKIQTSKLPEQDLLREGVIYNDAHHQNILLECDNNGNSKILGAIDFGDSLFSWLISDLAIACTYSMLNKDNPLEFARPIVEGFNQKQPLNEVEISSLFSLICLRACMSVTIATYQKSLYPKNLYLQISERPMWKLIDKLIQISSDFAHFNFRHACGLEPSTTNNQLVTWLDKNHKTFSNIFHKNYNVNDFELIDLSISNPDLPNKKGDKKNNKILKPSISAFNEVRITSCMNQFDLLDDKDDKSETIHLGFDIFLPDNKEIFMPLDGVVEKIKNNTLNPELGASVIIRHKTKNLTFFTLYGNLCTKDILKIDIGQKLIKGNRISELNKKNNHKGDTPYLHFQVLTHLIDDQVTSMVKPLDRKIWLSISPDPSSLINIIKKDNQKNDPSPSFLKERRQKLIGKSLSLSYKDPIIIKKGDMQYLFDHEGKTYLDAINNVAHVGHCHPKVLEATRKQNALLNTNTRYLHNKILELAEKITSTMPDPLKVCYFTNSGSEANDLALRLAKAHTGGNGIITINGAYHGNLSSLIDISPYKFSGPGGKGPAKYIEVVPMPDGYRGEYKYFEKNIGELYSNDIKEAIKKLEKKTKLCAFISESMINCGGVIIPPKGYLKKSYEFVRNSGGLCIADEVVVGFGRTGKYFWGFQYESIIPDIVTVGKAMGNGHPVAAVITTQEIASSFETGMEYFNTFGGNPVSCATALAVIDILNENKLQQNAYNIGIYLLNNVKNLQKKYDLLGDVRGKGLFIGIELVKNKETLEPASKHANYIVERMKDNGILISSGGMYHNVLKIRPPMVFNKLNVDLLLKVLNEILEDTFCKRISF
ncbi:MAG: hypothetical protein CMG75_09845 [Candidatus Marinimicrobia bacterium]|nr:hypothetical protein [Candidatus Neomarinimicrobiota bacterium]|tara:strand:- start:1370 stop:4399 length:3030 start_codon:yes stop_codon:yes gene_type:complete